MGLYKTIEEINMKIGLVDVDGHNFPSDECAKDWNEVKK